MHAETSSDVQPSPARRGAALVAAIALAGVALTGVVLAWRYHPDGLWSPHDQPSPAAWSRRLVRWHQVSMLVAVPALIAWAVLTVREGARRAGAVAVLAVASLALVAVTARAWQQVRFSQLALLAVSVDGDHRGLWFAAFSEDVRFAFVDGVGEVPPGDLQPWVVTLLTAPVVALALLAGGWFASRPPRGPRGPRRTIVPAPSEPLR